MNLKKWPLLLCILLLLSLLLGGCVQEKPLPEKNMVVIGFSQVGAESDWRCANTASMNQAFSESNGYRLLVDEAQQKPERQITAIRNFIQMGVDYIILAPTRETGWDTVLGEAKAAGIPVIVVDRMIEVEDQSLYVSWVGSDFRKEGDLAIAHLRETLADRPLRIVHLQGTHGSSAQLGRTAALDEALRTEPGWTLVARESGDFTEAKGQELVGSWLADGLDFNVIYSENDNMTYGAITALKEAGRVPGKDVIIVSFDAARRGLEYTMSGEISFDAECNPLHGPRVLSLVQAMLAGKPLGKLHFVTETSFSSRDLTREIIDSREY